MPNIGFLTANHYPRLGGMEYAVHHLVESLNKIENVKAAVSCATLPEIDRQHSYSYPCYRSKSFSYLTPWLFQRNQQKMIAKENIDILHGPMLHGGGFWAQAQSERFELPFVAQSRGSDVQVVPKINYGAILDHNLKKKVQKVLKAANKLIALSEGNKMNMIALGARAEKIDVIPNGIHIKEISKVPYVDMRVQWNINPEDFILITVGRNRPVKRMELLFKALQKLKNYNKIKCLCVGPEENLGQLAEKHRILDKVILTGRIPFKINPDTRPPYRELINAYRAANVYISTSYVESFGNTAADALACGIPILIGANHGVQDIITKGETGWTMEKETPDELAEMILGLYKERENLRERSSMIRKSVEYLTWNYIADQTANLYEKILQ